MLILSRRVDEEVLIGGLKGGRPIRVMVVELRQDRVKLGFDAPDGVPVHRAEIYDDIERHGSTRETRENASGQKASDQKLSGGNAAEGGSDA